MADFEIAYKRTGRIEGGLSNDPDDHGGLTYAGIAYNFWPKWEGWARIKEVMSGKTLSQANVILKNDSQVQQAIDRFYKENFWDINLLDEINDQQLANNVYDCGVNEGTGRSAKLLQQAAGVAVDGKVGSKTIAAVNGGSASGIYNKMNALRLQEYLKLAQNPGQAKFLSSWKSRLTPYVPVA